MNFLWHKCFKVAVGGVICLSWAASGIAAEKLSLHTAVLLTLENAPSIRAAEAERDATKQDYNIGLSGLLPRVDVSASYQLLKQNTLYVEPQTVFRPSLDYGQGSASLRIVQPLFDLSRWASYQQGAVSEEIGEMRLRVEKQKLMLEAAQAYLDVVLTESSLRATQAKKGAATRLAAQAQAMFKSGMSAVNERLDAEAKLDLVSAEEISAENEWNQAKARFESLTGTRSSHVEMPYIPEKLTAPDMSQEDAWIERAEDGALPVLLARLQFNAAVEAESKSWADGLPKVEVFTELSGSRSTSGQLGATKTQNQTLGIQLNMPLFSGFGTWAQYRKSKKSIIRAEFSLQDDVRLARLTAQQSFLAYTAALKRLKAMRKAVQSAKETAKGARMGVQVGLRTILDVLDADERRFDAEKRLTEAEGQLVFAELQLSSSIGMLDAVQIPLLFGAGVK